MSKRFLFVLVLALGCAAGTMARSTHPQSPTLLSAGETVGGDPLSSPVQTTHIIKCPDDINTGIVNAPQGWTNDTRYPMTNLGIHIEPDKTKGGIRVRCAYRDKEAQYYYLNRHLRVGVTCEKVDNYSVECRVGFKKNAP